MNIQEFIRCCQNGDLNALEQNAQEISQAINKNEYQIGDLITELRPLLTDTNETSRSNGIKIISQILLTIGCDTLNDLEVKCILDFFNNRMKDKISVIEALLPGLKALCEFTHFDFEMASSLFFNFNNEVSIQALKPDAKAQIYRLIKQLFARYKLDFINLGFNFVHGILQIIEAETSPTCLVEVFDLLRQIASVRKLELFKEEIFDSMSCYFPIIYSKQKNDKHLETKIQLSSLLNRAMTATPCFAEFVIPLVLEKLESESIGSKLSSYQLLCCALPQYSFNQVEPFANELWTIIRIDTLRPKNDCDELTTSALQTLTQLCRLLSSNSSSVYISFFEKIWKDLEISLKSPELNLINSSVDIFIAASSENCQIFGYFFKRANPILLQSFLFSQKDKHKTICLKALFDLLLVGRKIDFQFETETVERFFNLLIDHSASDIELELRQSIMLFLNELVCVHKLQEPHIEKLIHYLAQFAEKCVYDQFLGKPVFELVANMTIYNSSKILSLFIEPLKSEIESSIFSATTTFLQSQILFQLAMLRSASREISIFSSVNQFLVKTFINLWPYLESEFHYTCSLSILTTLASCFEIHRANREFVQIFRRTCMTPILKHLTCSSFKQSVSIPLEMIQQISFLNATFLSAIDVEESQKHLREQIKIQEGEVTNQMQHLYCVKVEEMWTNIDPANCTATQANFYLSIIYSHIFGINSFNCVQTLLSVFAQVKSFCFEYYQSPEDLSLQTTTNLSCMILSNILLRFDETPTSKEKLTLLCKELFQEMKNIISSADATLEHKTIAINILMWTCKSLYTRNFSSLYNDYVSFFLKVLDNQECLKMQILKLVDIIFSGEDFFQPPPLAQLIAPSERFSVTLHNLLLARLKQTSNRDEFLTLFFMHLRFIPREIFEKQITQLLPIVMKGLQISNVFEQNNLICLSFVENMIRNHSAEVRPHSALILNSIIGLARNGYRLQVRKLALDCVCLIIDSSSEQDLTPLKVELLRSLQPTLGDHKRLVRASAVKAFCKLSMLGQPGNRSK